MRRYGGNANWLMIRPFLLGFETIKQIEIYERESELREEWLQVFPLMTAGMIQFKSCKEYIDARMGRNIDVRPSYEVEADINEAMKRLEKAERVFDGVI